MFGYFTIKEYFPTLFLKHTPQMQSIDIDSIKNETQIYNMVIDTIDNKDFDFIEKLFSISAKNDYTNSAIMATSMSEECANFISKIAEKYPEKKGNNKTIVSISAATDNVFSDDIYIGTYLYDKKGCFYAQPINNTLRYRHFKEILPKAESIIKSIPSQIKNNKLDLIVWIDNWFQKNIKYAKGRTTIVNNESYIDNSIAENHTAVMTDVFNNHFGVCEDIATSIVVLLHMLNINCTEIQANGHAWLEVEIDNQYYIWDCTHNITRNPNRKNHELRAGSYTHKFTLIAQSDKYYIQNHKICIKEFDRKKILESKGKLQRLGVSFNYQ